MKADPRHKDKFFEKYVSTHNALLYGETDLKRIKNQFSSWQGAFGKFLPQEKDSQIVDLGCGNGSFVLWLQESGYRNAQGVDVSPEQIKEGERLGIKNIKVADLRDFLKNRKKYFDASFLRDVLGHLESKDEVMKVLELCRQSLRDNGIIIVKTPNAESPMTGRLRYGDFTHDISFTGQSLRQALLIAGFKDVCIYGMPPVVHGAKSAARYLFWKIIELGLKFYRLVEAGSGEGIFTQNIVAVAKK